MTDQREIYRDLLTEGKRDAIAGGTLGGCITVFVALVLVALLAVVYVGAAMLWRRVV